jgi:regulator of sigma E protease
MLTILAFIVVLGVLIFVHELGHFMTAKWADIEVPRFSIGFGPRVLGFRRGETEYVISALPLGGYVKMAGMEEMEQVEGGPVTVDDLSGDDETIREIEMTGERKRRPRDFESKSLPVRALVISAGVIMNFLFAALLFAVMAGAWGVPADPGLQVARVVQDLLPEGAEPLADVPAGAIINEVDGEPVTTRRELHFAFLRAREGPMTLGFENAPSIQFTLPPADERRALVLQALEPTLPMPPVIQAVNPGGAAAEAGLRAGDRVLAVDGRPIERWQQLVAAIEPRAGTPLQLDVERDGRRIALVVTPVLRQRDTGVSAGFIDVQGPPVPRERIGPVAAIGRGFSDTWLTTRQTLDFLGGMLTGRHSARNLGGPIMIAQFSGRAARLGLEQFLGFMALLSVNLAVLNLLPIPVLDGGHLVFLGIEAVRGRPLSFDQRMRLTQVGFVFIILLMAWAFGNDLLRVFGL